MTSRIASLLLASLFLTGTASIGFAEDPAENNCAPFYSSGVQSTLLASRMHGLGPLYEKSEDGSITTEGFRPLYVTSWDSTTDSGWTGILYPLYVNRVYPGGSRWTVFELGVGAESTSVRGTPVHKLELWPVYWHYDNGVPAESYDAIMPIAGTIRNHLFCKRIDWFLFPVFSRFEKDDHTDTVVLFPIVRHREGPESSGWAVWPLYGHFEKTGAAAYDRTYALWPLYYDNTRSLSAKRGGGEYETFGALPFYASERAPGLCSRTFVWPFFGYTRESAPRPAYSEIRWFYPLVVTGSGETKSVTRFLPLYDHEESVGFRKSWYLWPLYKREDSRVTSVDIHRDQFLFFVFKNEVQTAPGTQLHARKTQFWPLFGYIDDGAGRRQLQVLNPFEPIFGGNEQIRKTWTPLFAVYRQEEAGDELRRSVLWDLVLYDRNGKKSSFSVGPLFSLSHSGDGASWSVAKGLLRRKNDAGGARWTAFWGLVGGKGE